MTTNTPYLDFIINIFPPDIQPIISGMILGFALYGFIITLINISEFK